MTGETDDPRDHRSLHLHARGSKKTHVGSFAGGGTPPLLDPLPFDEQHPATCCGVTQTA
jgi:hypothetical protein